MEEEEYADVPSLYGMQLNDLVLDEKYNVPTFLPIVCDYIKRFAATEGVFRKCGRKTLVNMLGILFNWREVAVPPCANVLDIAGFLKEWLRALPDPLVDRAVLKERYNPDVEESVVDFLRGLPMLNRKCLAFVFSTLIEFRKFVNQNRMEDPSIGICLGSCFTRETFPLIEILLRSERYLNSEGSDFNLE